MSVYCVRHVGREGAARLEQVRAMTTEALARAEQDPQGLKYAAGLIRELHNNLELFGRLSGRLDAGGTEIRIGQVIVFPRPRSLANEKPAIDLQAHACPDNRE